MDAILSTVGGLMIVLQVADCSEHAGEGRAW